MARSKANKQSTPEMPQPACQVGRWRRLEEQLHALLIERAPEDFLHARLIGPSKASPVAHNLGTRHVARKYELYFLIEGKLALDTPEQTFLLRPGHLLLIDPGVEHEERPATPTTPHLRSCLQLVNTKAELYEIEYKPPAYRPEVGLGLVGPEDLEAVAALISTELTYRDTDWHEAAHELVHYLGTTLLRRFRSGSFSEDVDPEMKDYRRSPVIHAVLTYCGANLRRSCRIKDIAAEFGYSPNHLGSMLVKYLGTPLSQHIRMMRLAVAVDLLEHSDLTIAQIAEHVGYDYPRHFTRAFTKAMKISPRAYRRERHIRNPAV